MLEVGVVHRYHTLGTSSFMGLFVLLMLRFLQKRTVTWALLLDGTPLFRELRGWDS